LQTPKQLACLPYRAPRLVKVKLRRFNAAPHCYHLHQCVVQHHESVCRQAVNLKASNVINGAALAFFTHNALLCPHLALNAGSFA